MKIFCIYILTNKKRGSLYIGVTSDLINRINNHKRGLFEGFSKKYKTNKLVYYETTNDVYGAINREKQLKNWHRKWKINLIEKNNPEWKDLYYDLVDPETSSG